MDVQDQHANNTFESYCGANVCMEIVKEARNIKNLEYEFDDDAGVKNMTAHSLRSLLSSRLGTQTFYFISGQQNSVPTTNLNNEDISCIRDTSYFNSTCNTNKSNSVSSNDCSMFGSPLKLQTIANLSGKSTHTSSPVTDILKKHRDLATPLPLSDARKLLLKFSQKNAQESCVNMMVAFCDGNDYNKTVLLGGHIENTGDGKVLTTFRVTVGKRKISEFEQPSEKTEQGHKLTARYRLLDKIDGLGSLVLETRWSDPFGKMKLIELHSAEFLLHIDVASGCDQSPVFNYYCQLQKVQMFLEGLKTGELPEVFSQKTQKALIQLNELFTRIKDGGAAAVNLFRCEDNKNTSVTGILCGTAKQLKLEPFSECDFTDILWKVISNCTDMNDLVQCINTTFCALRKGDLKVFVHKSNQTTIAKLVRQFYCGMASFPLLNGHLPLCLATEIGMEKIRKDYHSIFINNSLCTSWQWDSFFQTLTPVQEEIMDMQELNVRSLETQWDILSKLHHCLEIVSVVDSFTESQDVKSIAKHVMNYYKSGKRICDSFTIPITALHASPEIKKHSLSSIKRESNGAGVCNVISLMSELPDELAMPFSTLLENGDSSFLESSRDFYMFRSQEHTLHFDWTQ